MVLFTFIYFKNWKTKQKMPHCRNSSNIP